MVVHCEFNTSLPPAAPSALRRSQQRQSDTPHGSEHDVSTWTGDTAVLTLGSKRPRAQNKADANRPGDVAPRRRGTNVTRPESTGD